jgi:predicted HicB family RNase H-like nuclease
MAKTSKAQQKATNKYIAKAYDRLNIVVPKGKREEIKDYAQRNGESLNGYVCRLIKEDMEKE